MNNEQLSNALTWLLAAVSLFFIGLGARDEGDVFLLLGNISCAFADAAFAAHLFSQRAGGANATLTTAYACGAVAAIYVAAHQAALLRARGCGDDDAAGADADADADGADGDGDDIIGGAAADAVGGPTTGNDEASELARLREGLRKAAAGARTEREELSQTETEPPPTRLASGAVKRPHR